MTLTEEQRQFARHALGLPNKRRQSFRKHYVGYEEAWERMVEAGAARKRPGSELSGGDPIYLLTRAGAEAALDKGERLDPEDFPTPVDNGRQKPGGDDDR